VKIKNCAITLIASIALAGCGSSSDVQIDILSRTDSMIHPDFYGIAPKVPACLIAVSVHNNGKGMLRKLKYQLTTGKEESRGGGKSSIANEVAINGAEKNNVVFLGACEELPASFGLEVTECLIGDTDCKNSVSLQNS